MKKRLAGIATTGLAFLTLLSACGSSGSGQSQTSGSEGSSSGEQKAEQVTLTYGLWDQVQVPAMEEIIAKFKQQHPNIDVKIQLTPWSEYWTKLETAGTGGTLPDVFWMNGGTLPKYAANGLLLQLDDYAKQDSFDFGAYPQPLVNLYSYDDKHYGVPKDYDVVGLWYNKTLFDEAHIPYPDETWDWNKAVEVAKKLTNPEKGIWGLPAQFQGQTGYYNTILEAGGGFISEDGKKSLYDTPEAIRGLKLQTDLIHVHKVSPTLAQMTDTAPKDLFKSGKVAMLTDGSWNVKDFATNEYTKDKIDIAVLPKDKLRTCVIHGLGNVAAANTKHPKEVWEFLKFLGSKEAAEIQAKDGTALPAIAGGQELWIKSVPQFHLQKFIDMANQSIQLPRAPVTAKLDGLEAEYLKKAYTGEATPEQAAKELAEKITEQLNK
ncbi:ABC transporter substrate-binding protein [Paenibacillus beijingensis]|uniref:Sugar ABC transporter substrate-binding protein n=1 Tax=Paenibacillus beijingensis TaxID=1126833 RepID=A0A0D5NKF2_9BACL|nr:sugar ABC transporter substrate-binding protein [Paenibacillus beijingensis]AJY75492.1 sugar ABC transporter substrate-binding protein [Paenibacillus beijingensis]